ncbi:CBS domain-containing protein [Pseudooceanicola sp.]|uniref:CBS domain-containing protein n=1 Tax=Pseudooceanicola sp. TaxID=1914328 RepID=UPI002614E2E3|nr:CBS domain-containing protein [Pseudooceanicola sp.]MDF1854706.1 CBS domain-containing protein [Pseudooceanicola sp.]
MSAKNISDIIRGRSLFQIAPDVPVSEACARLAQHQIGALPVVENGRLIGIVSERDVIGRVVGCGLSPETIRVREAMTAEPETINAGSSVAQAAGVMLGGGFRHLPVVREGALVGMISLRDIPAQYHVLMERQNDYVPERLSA